jgi:lysophospholipase L1-like esterase
VRRAAALPLALGLLLLIAPAADALTIRASAHQRGRIALRVQARSGVELTVRDELTGAQRVLTPSAEEIVLRRFASWSCASAMRRFTATQAAPDGTPAVATAQVSTPSCAHRMTMAGPRVTRAPHGAAMHLRDRWRLGDFAVRFCVRPPGARERCRSVQLRAGPRERTVRFRAVRPGGYVVTASMPYQRVRSTMRANPPRGRLRILATGDSMIQLIDSFMRARPGSRRALVRSDARVSTGISKPSLLDWRAHAREQVASIRPDVTVMFIGANDGFPMAGADCCGAPWIAEYARRARQMMRTYARGGRGRVYWLLLPAARDGFFREIFPAVNAALRQAAAGLEDDVRLIELDEVFTPGGRFRKSMKIDGKRVGVRQSDGVHLNTTGAALAARLVIAALRHDRMLR